MRRWILPASLFAACVVRAAMGCQGYLAHAFGGYAYDAVNDCLESSAVVDVISGADPGQCPMLRCWLAPCGAVYVTDEACDAPPDYQDQTHAASGQCVKALAAYGRAGHAMCAPPPDGGADAGGLGCGL
jgi:hypothetical protein